jgi:ribosome-associated protein
VKAKALAIAEAALAKKAIDVVVLDVAKLTSVADYLVLCSGESGRQAHAIADHIDGELSRLGEAPATMEGGSSSQWVLLDFGDVVVHVFQSEVRAYYALEKLWGDAKRVPVGETELAPEVRPKLIKLRKSVKPVKSVKSVKSVKPAKVAPRVRKKKAS